MAVSRRFETRFAYNLFAIQNGTLKLQTGNLIVSNQNASNSSYPYLGIPPLNYYAFLSQNVMDANNGRWWLIASNTGSGNPYPNTIKSYSDSVWGRLPHQISWRTSRPGIPSSNFGTYNKSGIYTLVALLGYEYVIGFGYYHPICVENNSSKSVVVKYRCLDKYFFTGGNVVIKYTDWQTITLSSNVTKELTGFEPMEIKFEAGALGDGTHAYSVTDQRGVTKRINTGSNDYILRTSDSGIIDTPVTGGQLAEDDGPIIVDDYIIETVTEGTSLVRASDGGKNLLFGDIGAGENKLLYSAIISEEDEPDSSGGPPPATISGYAFITISWYNADYSDLDCCGYWDQAGFRDSCVGWSYSTNNVENAKSKAVWQGDNTGGGPEYIQVAVASNIASGLSKPYNYKINLNFYGEGITGGGSTSAIVTVVFGNTSVSKTINASANRGQKAMPGDPSVLITFDANGTPTIN